MMYSAIMAMVLVFAGGSIASDQCVQSKSNPCVFQKSDGKVIDLSPFKKPISSQREVILFEYFQFSPCAPFHCNSKGDALLCRHRVTKDMIIPKADNPSCTIEGNTPKLTYKYKEETAIVSLICSKGSSKLDHDFVTKKGTFSLKLSSPYACETTVTTQHTTTNHTTPTKKTTKHTTHSSPTTHKNTTHTTKTPTTHSTPSHKNTTHTTKTPTTHSTPSHKNTTQTAKTTHSTKPSTNTPKKTTTPGRASSLTSVVSVGTLAALILSVHRVIKI